MSDKYIPTTADVRRAYQEHCRDYDAVDGLATSPESYEEEFDRWSARFRAEAQVEALEDLATAHYLDGPQSTYDTIMRYADRIALAAGIKTGESND